MNTFIVKIACIALFLSFAAHFQQKTVFAETASKPAQYHLRGVIWSDLNNNGITDEHEPRSPHAILYIQAIIDTNSDAIGLSDLHLQRVTSNQSHHALHNDYSLIDEDRDIGLLSVVQANEDGYYKISDSNTGIYRIWVGSAGEASEAVELQVGESEGLRAEMVNLPARAQHIFVPMITR